MDGMGAAQEEQEPTSNLPAATEVERLIFVWEVSHTPMSSSLREGAGEKALLDRLAVAVMVVTVEVPLLRMELMED